MSHQKVPLADLSLQHSRLQSEIKAAIDDVILSSSFIRGHHVDAFEENFARLTGSDYCISCANGTDSLYICMKTLGLKPGDEVIVPAHSWISTSETVTQAGGKVVFCDTHPHNFTIDSTQIESKITSRTVGIIPVHLYGHPADMSAIMNIARRHNLWVLEDCAQAHLAKYNNRLVGTFGNAASYSFYPGKNLGAMGDAGAITTNDIELANGMKRFARHGGLTKGEHIIEGINSRMDGLQAAILNVKLPHLEGWNKLRQDHAKTYLTNLNSISGIRLPYIEPYADHVWHLFVIKSKSRDRLKSFLDSKGISSSINYPIALPFLEAYSRYSFVPSDFPNAYMNQSQILSLPLFPEMTEDQKHCVIKSMIEFCTTISS